MKNQRYKNLNVSLSLLVQALFLAFGTPGLHAQELQIVSPSQHEVFEPGEEVDISIQSNGGLVLSNVAAKLYGEMFPQSSSDQAPFDLSVILPDSDLGFVRIDVVGIDANTGDVYGDSVVVKMETATALQSIEVTQPKVELNYVPQTYQINVTGQLADGREVGLSDSSTGTSYETASGTTLFVDVNDQGLVTAKGAGYEIVLVTNGEQTTQLEVAVDVKNHRPFLELIEPFEVKAETITTLPLSASDFNGDELSYFVGELPEFTSFVDNGDGTAEIEFSPTLADLGQYNSSYVGVRDDSVSLPLDDSQYLQFEVVEELSGGDDDDDGSEPDQDGDGISDDLDNCPSVANSNQQDQDQDGQGDACDADDDGDGSSDTNDNCPLTFNPNQEDSDGDGIGDACDNDQDGDGIDDSDDNCPYDVNSSQADNDSDGQGDACDIDDDNDNNSDLTDSCPFTYNPIGTQGAEDYDRDGIANACDPDDDNDGIDDGSDNCALLYNPLQIDTDGDAQGNGCDPTAGARAEYDFTGDGKADFSVWRPGSGNWYVKSSNDLQHLTMQWGAAGHQTLSADYDGDGITDHAVYQQAGNFYFVVPSSGTCPVAMPSYYHGCQMQWGLSGDIPVPADYDGDGRADPTVWRPSNGTWYIKNPQTGAWVGIQWGLSGDTPIPGDFNGDGYVDLAVYRASTNTWYVKPNGNGTCPTGFSAQYGGCASQWGAVGDIPVHGDFDGDGKIDRALYRPGSGNWYAIRSSDQTLFSVQLGQSGDVLVAADYDGDGITDPAVWRQSVNAAGGLPVFYTKPSTQTYDIQCPAPSTPIAVGQLGCQYQWGLNGDVPLP